MRLSVSCSEPWCSVTEEPAGVRDCNYFRYHSETIRGMTLEVGTYTAQRMIPPQEIAHRLPVSSKPSSLVQAMKGVVADQVSVHWTHWESKMIGAGVLPAGWQQSRWSLSPSSPEKAVPRKFQVRHCPPPPPLLLPTLHSCIFILSTTRVACSLPPWLFFCDSLSGGPPSTGALEASATLLEQHMASDVVSV